MLDLIFIFKRNGGREGGGGCVTIRYRYIMMLQVILSFNIFNVCAYSHFSSSRR